MVAEDLGCASSCKVTPLQRSYENTGEGLPFEELSLKISFDSAQTLPSSPTLIASDTFNQVSHIDDHAIAFTEFSWLAVRPPDPNFAIHQSASNEGQVPVSNTPPVTEIPIPQNQAEPSWSTSAAGLQANLSGFYLAQDNNSEVLLAQDSSNNPETLEEDPELGIIRVRSEAEDPELGILRIREQPVVPVTAQAPRTVGFFTARMSVASSDNILLAVNDVGGLTGDEFVRPGISLAFYPQIGPQTFLIGNIDVGLQRYTTRSDINYDDLRFRLGVRQGLFPRTYGQLMFTYQQLFRPGTNRYRFFENAAFSFTLGRRDPLTDQLTLNSYYQVQLNDAESRSSPDSPTNFTDFDRVSQALGASLNYNISPQWLTGVSYQLTLADYTQQPRYDAYHQLLGQLVYRITPDVRMSVYGGWSFGRSSEPRIRFDDTLFGVTIDATVKLF